MMMMMEMTIVIIIKLFLICWPKSMYANNMPDFEVKILGIVKERPKLSGKAPLPPFSRCPKENLYPRGRSTLIDYHFRQVKKNDPTTPDIASCLSPSSQLAASAGRASLYNLTLARPNAVAAALDPTLAAVTLSKHRLCR